MNAGRIITLAAACCLCLILTALGVRVALAAAPRVAFMNMKTGYALYIPFTQLGASQDIYVINADGTGLTALTKTPEHECYPAWSPDGSKIAFAKRKGGSFVISMMNSDGSNVHDLFAPDLTKSLWDVECTPVWSPDGSKIAFTSSRDGDLEVYLMNADGSKPINLTNNPACDGLPTWSPDGKQIAFTSDRDGNAQIYTMDASGGNVQNLTNDKAADYSQPAWTHKGREISFITKNGGDRRISLIEHAGARRADIECSAANPVFGDWSPDGNRMVFFGTESRRRGICLLDRTTSALTMLIESPPPQVPEVPPARPALPEGRTFCGPQWSPDGKRVVFSGGPSGPSLFNQRRWMHLGAHGELIATRKNFSPNGNELRLEPLDGGFALVHTGRKWSGTYAIVRPDGKIQIIEPLPKEVDPLSVAHHWPFLDEQGLPIPAPPDTVVVGEGALSPPITPPPNDYLGFMYISAEGGLIAPAPGAQPCANVLWVVRKGNGLELVHSGPKWRGKTFAVVAPDGTITLISEDAKGPVGSWPCIDEAGLPVIPQPRMVLGNDCRRYANSKITLFANGGGSMPALEPIP